MCIRDRPKEELIAQQKKERRITADAVIAEVTSNGRYEKSTCKRAGSESKGN